MLAHLDAGSRCAVLLTMEIRTPSSDRGYATVKNTKTPIEHIFARYLAGKDTVEVIDLNRVVPTTILLGYRFTKHCSDSQLYVTGYSSHGLPPKSEPFVIRLSASKRHTLMNEESSFALTHKLFAKRKGFLRLTYPYPKPRNQYGADRVLSGKFSKSRNFGDLRCANIATENRRTK